MLRRLNHLLSAATHRACNSRMRRNLETRWGGFGSILMMHRVVADKADSAAASLTITTAFLDQALVTLRAAGVEFLTLKDLFARLAVEGSSRGAVALTFDDGYRDNLTLALPILRKHRAPATIFVPSGAPDRAMDAWFLRLDHAVLSCRSISLGEFGIKETLPAETPAEKRTAYRRVARLIHHDLPRNRSLPEMILPKRRVSDEALLADYFADWSELRTGAADPLITIGAHTVRHPVLGALPEAEARREIVDGRARLESQLDRDVELLSYPYGGRTECGPREYRIAEEAGFDLAVTTRYGGLHRYHDRQRHALPRKTLGGLRETIDALLLDVLGRRPAGTRSGQGTAATQLGLH